MKELVNVEVSKEGGLPMGVLLSLLFSPIAIILACKSYWILFILTLPIIAAIFLSKKGFSVNQTKDQYRFFTQIGIMKFGDWKPMGKPDFLAISSSTRIEATHSNDVIQTSTSIEREFTNVYIRFNNQKKGLRVISTYSEKKGNKVLKKLQKAMQIPVKKI